MQREDRALAASPASRAPTGADAAGQWDLDPNTTLARLLALNARTHGSRVALREKALGIWQEFTWAQVLDEVLAVAAGLEHLGFTAGDSLLVLGDNRARLYMGMLAAGALGGYAMPVYPDATPAEVLHFASEAQAHFALAEDQEQVDKVLELREKAPGLSHVVYDDPRGLNNYRVEGLIGWEKLRDAGAARLREHPAVRSAEALGVPDEEWGNRLVAFVEGEMSLEEARDWVAEAHPRAWAPRQVVVLPHLPLLANGKTDRLALRDLATEAR